MCYAWSVASVDFFGRWYSEGNRKKTHIIFKNQKSMLTAERVQLQAKSWATRDSGGDRAVEEQLPSVCPLPHTVWTVSVQGVILASPVSEES